MPDNVEFLRQRLFRVYQELGGLLNAEEFMEREEKLRIKDIPEEDPFLTWFKSSDIAQISELSQHRLTWDAAIEHGNKKESGLMKRYHEERDHYRNQCNELRSHVDRLNEALGTITAIIVPLRIAKRERQDNKPGPPVS
jgi:hypothetical protein